jgi:hypothetical protein
MKPLAIRNWRQRRLIHDQLKDVRASVGNSSFAVIVYPLLWYLRLHRLQPAAIHKVS